MKKRRGTQEPQNRNFNLQKRIMLYRPIQPCSNVISYPECSDQFSDGYGGRQISDRRISDRTQIEREQAAYVPSTDFLAGIVNHY